MEAEQEAEAAQAAEAQAPKENPSLPPTPSSFHRARTRSSGCTFSGIDPPVSPQAEDTAPEEKTPTSTSPKKAALSSTPAPIQKRSAMRQPRRR